MDKTAAHTRLVQAVDFMRFRGIPMRHEDISQKMANRRASVSLALGGDERYLTTRFIKRFADAYADYINPSWLIDGVGPMTPDEVAATRPHIPEDVATVAAGFVGTDINSAIENQAEMRPYIDAFSNYDFSIRVNGDSMLPVLYHYDTIFCRRLDRDDIPDLKPDRSIYVVETENGAVVKLIKQITPDTLILASLNTAFNDIEVPKADILRISLVVGSLRRLI